MELFFRDPNEPPLPPTQVRIIELQATPRSDGRRVRVYLRLTAFQNRPSGDIRILNANGDEMANISFIEAISPRMEFTIHLKGETANPYKVLARLYYPKQEKPDEIADSKQKIEIVDQAQIEFEIPNAP